jgi:hypothetical protein
MNYYEPKEPERFIAIRKFCGNPAENSLIIAISPQIGAKLSGDAG